MVTNTQRGEISEKTKACITSKAKDVTGVKLCTEI